MGESVLPAMGGLLLRHNRRYGGFVVHLGILVIALGVTGSQAWSVQTETTLKPRRGGRAGRLSGSVSTGSPRSEESNHFKVVGTFTVMQRTRARAPCCSPPRSSIPRSSRRSPTSTTRSASKEDVYLVLGDFARDGSQATVKVQVNRLVSWIWIGGVILTLGAALWPSCPSRVGARVKRAGAG